MRTFQRIGQVSEPQFKKYERVADARVRWLNLARMNEIISGIGMHECLNIRGEGVTKVCRHPYAFIATSVRVDAGIASASIPVTSSLFPLGKLPIVTNRYFNLDRMKIPTDKMIFL